MIYIEVSFTIPLNHDASDILPALLSEIGFDSFAEEEGVLRAYVPEESFDEQRLKEVLAASPILPITDSPIQEGGGEAGKRGNGVAYAKKLIPSQNWNKEWEKNFQPVIIAGKCCIRASFHPAPDNTPIPPHSDSPIPGKAGEESTAGIIYDILIEPKMAFGTGHHETTYLMAEQLMKLELKGKTLLDMGCGTGILAILASKMGAKEVLAIDSDENAVLNSIENVQINMLKNVNVEKGDAGLLVNRRFPVILANINRNILLADMERYYNSMEKGGILLLSGFFESDEPALMEKANSLGLKFVEKAAKNRWCVLKFIK